MERPRPGAYRIARPDRTDLTRDRDRALRTFAWNEAKIVAAYKDGLAAREAEAKAMEAALIFPPWTARAIPWGTNAPGSRTRFEALPFSLERLGPAFCFGPSTRPRPTRCSIGEGRTRPWSSFGL